MPFLPSHARAQARLRSRAGFPFRPCFTSLRSRARASFPARARPHPDSRLRPPRGDYQTLLSFQKAEIVYDVTFRFAHPFRAKNDRTLDPMIQSARSGKKNIRAGSKAALTSKETEIKLTHVARASLEELLDDSRDFLRARDFP